MKKQSRSELKDKLELNSRIAFAQNNSEQKKYVYDQGLWLESASNLLRALEPYRLKSDDTFKFPKTKDNTNLLRAYIRHCYVKYQVEDRWYDIFNRMSSHVPYPLLSREFKEVQKFLSESELEKLTPSLMRHKDGTLSQFLTLVSGGSLHKKHFSNILTKKETHAFVTCKIKNLSLSQALVYSIAKGKNGNEKNSLALANSRFTEQNINSKFWYESIGFFAQEHTLKSSELNEILDFLVAKKGEDNNFTIVGRGYSVASVAKKSKDWHFAIQRAKQYGDYHWNHCSLSDWQYMENNEAIHTQTVWSCEQIKTSKELSKEGTAMHHCVSSYQHKCRSGDCSIWSMRINDNRKLTIEVTHINNDNTIMQVSGFANRRATYIESLMVKKFAIDLGLELNSRVFS